MVCDPYIGVAMQTYFCEHLSRHVLAIPCMCAGGGGRKAGNGLILVFDFGGGTLDVSMLGLSDGVFVTLAIAGTSATLDEGPP